MGWQQSFPIRFLKFLENVELFQFSVKNTPHMDFSICYCMGILLCKYLSLNCAVCNSLEALRPVRSLVVEEAKLCQQQQQHTRSFGVAKISGGKTCPTPHLAVKMWFIWERLETWFDLQSVSWLQLVACMNQYVNSSQTWKRRAGQFWDLKCSSCNTLWLRPNYVTISYKRKSFESGNHMAKLKMNRKISGIYFSNIFLL